MQYWLNSIGVLAKDFYIVCLICYGQYFKILATTLWFFTQPEWNDSNSFHPHGLGFHVDFWDCVWVFVCMLAGRVGSIGQLEQVTDYPFRSNQVCVWEEEGGGASWGIALYPH